MKHLLTVLIAVSALALSVQVRADEECAFKWDIHKEHTLFAGSSKATAAATTAAAAPLLNLDTLYSVKLSPADGVKYDVPSEKKMLTDGTFGGTLKFKVPTTGAYRISLDGKVWIDVVAEHQLVAAKDFGGPHDCPGGPKKLVEFELKEGVAYLLQISGAPTQEMKVSVTRSAP